MIKVINLFKQIQETSSLNDKKAIIIANKDNELFKECLKFLLDGNVTTGIAEKKYDAVKVITPDWIHNDVNQEFKELLNYIKQHNTGRDEDIIQVHAWCYDFSEDPESVNFVTNCFPNIAYFRCLLLVFIVQNCVPNGWKNNAVS